jgi:hypothetical protein
VRCKHARLQRTAALRCGLAAPQQRFRDTALLAVGMAIAACLLFPLALQLPLRILP